MLTTVFGKRGSGKTTIIRAMVKAMKKPVIIPDLIGKYSTYQDEVTEKTITMPYDHVLVSDIGTGLKELKAYVENPKDHEGIIVYQGADLQRAVDFFCSALWNVHGGSLVLDEADEISLSDSPCFDDAIRYGRNRGIDLVTGCRRPYEIDRSVTAGANLALILSTQEPRDLEYYMEFLGEEISETLMRLPPHHGIYKNFDTQTTGTFKAEKTGKIVFKTGKRPDSALDHPGIPEPEGRQADPDRRSDKDSRINKEKAGVEADDLHDGDSEDDLNS